MVISLAKRDYNITQSDDEVWKCLKYPKNGKIIHSGDHIISNTGRVYTFKSHKFLNIIKRSDNSQYFKMRVDGKNLTISILLAMATTFDLENPNNYTVIVVKNPNQPIHINNIKWVRSIYEHNGGVSVELVHKICSEMEDSDWTYRSIVDKLGIKHNIPSYYSLISRIKDERAFVEISKNYRINKDVTRAKTRVPKRKLTNDIVKEICLMMEEDGWKHSDILKKYNINSYVMINNIYLRKTYTTISLNYNFKPPYTIKISDEIVHTICKYLKSGIKTSKICQELDIQYKTVLNIKTKKTFKRISDLYF